MLFQAFVAALGAGVAAAQLTSQCEFVSFSPAKGSDPIEYTARCSTTPGGHAKTCSQLDLSHCLANEDGHLQLPTHGNTEVFTKTCPSCHVDGGGRRLYCLCERMDMSYNYTWVELNDVIRISQGILTCSSTVGKKLSECPISQIGPPTVRRHFVA